MLLGQEQRPTSGQVAGFLLDSTPGLLSWTALFILGLFGTGLAYVINYALIRSEGARGTSVVTYLVLAFAAVAGALVSVPPPAGPYCWPPAAPCFPQHY